MKRRINLISNCICFRCRNYWLPAAIIAAGLGAVSYGTDFVVKWFGLEGSRTVWNDLIIGMLGGVAVFHYLRVTQRREDFEFAKERLRMIGQLNWRVRQTLMRMASSALSEDRHARLRGIDEATERIDALLSDLSKSPRVQGRSLPS